ncbi:MAG: phosphoglycerate kinase [Bacteroides sp. SM23_62_1]|nr:MAG: phosphoglycerate kinase [Bacteroides sp. SM23_62_1]
MHTIDNYDFNGKKVIMRVDFNVPLNDKFEVTDDTRIRAAIPSINRILEKGGATILMSHLGRPKEGPENKYSLNHVVPRFSVLLGKPVKFADDCIGEKTLEIKKSLKPGEVLLLENLRFHKEEEKGDERFSEKLAEGADVYVNDAFGTAHRAHASTTIVAKFFPNDSMFGYLIKSELESMDKVLHQSEKPFTAVMGGAKVSDKILIIENLLEKVDNLIIGGGMTYTFIRAQGGKTGISICEEDKLDLALNLINKAKTKGVKLLLPVDNVAADQFDNNATTRVTKSDEIPEGWMGLDIGPETIKLFSGIIEQSKTILWNGPMGVFEMENFQNGTVSIAKAIARVTTEGAFSLVGGGDSVAAVNKYDLSDKVSYVSTGGGAMLEYMEGKELPGIKAIRG